MDTCLEVEFLSFEVGVLFSLGGAGIKNPPANAGITRATDSISASGRSSGGGHGNPLQCSCLENPMDGGDWWATVCGITKNQTQLTIYTAQHTMSFYNNLSILYESCSYFHQYLAFPFFLTVIW